LRFTEYFEDALGGCGSPNTKMLYFDYRVKQQMLHWSCGTYICAKTVPDECFKGVVVFIKYYFVVVIA